MRSGSQRGTTVRFQAAVGQALAAARVGREDTLLVACSHGPDSLALADAILALRDQRRLGRVILAYVDHGLRAEARDEGQAVERLAQARGADARIARVKLRRPSEDAARAARYAALDEIADEVGARWIAFGHTASDQAETVLLRLIRGAGLAGLAGIPAVRGRYIRPLLALPRADVEAYLAARTLTPSHDASNETPAFTRNRVRGTILPALRAENPAVDEAIARAAIALREAAEALDWAAAEATRTVGLDPGSDSGSGSEPANANTNVHANDPDPSPPIRLHAAPLAALPSGLAKRVLSLAAAGLGLPLEARHLDSLRALASAPPAGSRAIRLPGATARREYGDLILEPTRPAGIPCRQVRVDVSGPEGPYRVRAWLPGDRMRPAALKGRSRKLQDLFTDRKVPARSRRQAVVVVREADGAIVWTEHIGSAVGVSLEVTLTEIPPQANT